MTNFQEARTAMVDCQVRPSDVTKYPIIEALLAMPREDFVPAAKRSVAYAGEHIALSSERILLDARTFSKMLDGLNIQPDELVLDVACGLGYSTAIIAKMSEAVVAIESDADLAQKASDILMEHAVDNAVVLQGDLTQGNAKNGPYDVIILQGAIETLPDTLADQLKDGGRICAIFSDGNLGECRIGHKSHGRISWRMDFNASAPTLTGFKLKPVFNFA
ncbi:MAG: protein-L-isoaspartate O-methyltransferase [Rhodobacteraceae bacterium]|nr:MAG: protein-L-isoaspartate O-methyltransferase [Paracoccaceae bacterium]